MTSPVAARQSGVLVAFYGQSLNGSPDAANAVPALLRAQTDFITYEPWEAGIAWVQFVKRYHGEIIAQANSAARTILHFWGGTTDFSAGRTGAQAYADVTTIATAAIAAGWDRTAISTCTPSTTLVGSPETERQAYNTAVMLNTGAFNATIDVAGDPLLDDPTDSAIYPDGTHISTAGAIRAGQLIIPEIVAQS